MTLDVKAATAPLIAAPARVVGRRELSEGVVELALEVTGDVPAWEPGAHIDLCLPSGTIRQYSLCGDQRDASLRVAVLREEDGRGGSREVHEKLLPGTNLAINGPRNHFRLEHNAAYVFVAGGIGITPILAMIREVSRSGGTWELFYGGRSLATMAYLDELEVLRRSTPGAKLHVVPENELGRIDLSAVARAAVGHRPVYACGPEPLLAALESIVGTELEPGQLHLERFAAASAADVTEDGALDEFEVVIASTNTVLQVGPDDRLIDVVRTVAPQVPFSCEEGYCGSCETGVLEGTPCHRDQVLTDDERATNETMMICVGRSCSRRLLLDL